MVPNREKRLYIDFSVTDESLEISGHYLILSDHPSHKKHSGILFIIETFFV